MYPEAINKQIELLQEFSNGIADAVIIIDASNGKLLAFNKAAIEFTGLSMDELKQTRISTLQVEPHFSIENLQTIAEKGTQIKYKAKFKSQFNQISDVIVTAKPINIDDIQLISVVVSKSFTYSSFKKPDIQSLKFFERFFRNNTLPLLLVDYSTLKILDANLVAEEFLGFPIKGIINTHLHKYTTLSSKEFNSTVPSFVANGYTGIELTFRTQSTGNLTVELHYTLAEIAGQNLLLCALIDITQKNRAFSELKSIKDNLADEVKLQTAELLSINNSLLDQIKKRRYIEEELRLSQNLFKHLFQSNPNGIILKNLDKNSVVEVNRSFLKTFGYNTGEVKDKVLDELGIFCSIKEYLAIKKTLKEKKHVSNVPLTMVTKIGHVVFALYSGEIIKIDNTKFLLEVYQDVTLNHIVQQKLAESEEKFRTLFNNALVGIFRTKITTGLLTSCNRQFARMLGYKSEKDILGRSIEEHFLVHSQRKQFLKNLKEKGTAVFEFELKTSSGKRIWVVDYATINLKERYIDEVLVDITDRKLIEDLLTQNENRFRSMIEKASDLIIIVNEDGKILYLSPSIRNELGYSIDNFAKDNVLDYISPSDVSSVSNLLKSKGISQFQSYEARVKHKDGYEKVYEFRATDLRSDSAIGGIILNARDVTERIKARDEINNSLLKEQELGRQKTQFISTVSHEFRTPLTNISLNVQLLNKYLKENRLEKAQHSIERMVNAEKRLTALLNEITLVSKDQSGRLHYNPEIWDINIFIDDLMEQISYLMQPNVKAKLNKGESFEVQVDKNLLSHIIGNLLSNAIKYSPKDKEIYLEVGVNGSKELIVLVKDNGIGIPVSEQQFLFDPYFRASNVKNVSGTGLGLSIVKRCVDLHGGKLVIKSQEGLGTEALFTLPLKRNNIF